MERPYQAFLLRIWLVGETQPGGLRLMLENPRTHESIGFNSLDELNRYLVHLVGEIQEGSNPAAENKPFSAA